MPDEQSGRGVNILPLAQQSVPDHLKVEARKVIKQMKERGYIDASEAEVSYLDKMQEASQFQAMENIAPNLKIVPANVESLPFEGVIFIGATAHGEDGRTGLTRIFSFPGFGIVGLKEVDYIASQGGITFIEEAINQDVNGLPAIFIVKKSRGRGDMDSLSVKKRQDRDSKGLTKLTWATDQKIYTLFINRALTDEKSIHQFMNLARSIF